MFFLLAFGPRTHIQKIIQHVRRAGNTPQTWG
jgi:hypothetical protein